MVGYGDFVTLSESSDSQERGQAAHLAARAYVGHTGPADEHAALYAALIGFLGDSSVKVRAALAYGLLHATEAPRPILLALLQDSPIIARAVAQYSPALLDADLLSLIPRADASMLLAVTMRERLGARVIDALLARGERGIVLAILARRDLTLSSECLAALTDAHRGDAELRGALLKRKELPASARLLLVEAAAGALRGAPLVQGAVTPQRLERLLRNSTDTAVSSIGEREAVEGRSPYTLALIDSQRMSSRLMLHAVVNGHVLFFADCIAELSGAPRPKVFSILEHGSRSALNALLARCGLTDAVRNLLCRLVVHARAADLADDVAARHYVVTALTEEIIVEHEGQIPPELEEAFGYLSEQNVELARRAASGVMSGFATPTSERALPLPPGTEQLALPAA